ncbi:VOC family protein [Novosphingobium sp. BL-8A]|uniref:VOC family protein n=1 Tax=Novosphingobium sp. BL-8A TaxID=3127639 RepID=UPI0037568375
MFSHICVGSNDLNTAKTFYDAVFGTMGATPVLSDPAAGRLGWMHNGSNFMVVSPLNGDAATFANGGTVGFTMDSADAVDAWHAAGCAAGGASCEDAPGPREFPFGTLYLAYLRDPDNNKLCAMYRAG